jgi:hypothetical protein
MAARLPPHQPEAGLYSSTVLSFDGDAARSASRDHRSAISMRVARSWVVGECIARAISRQAAAKRRYSSNLSNTSSPQSRERSIGRLVPPARIGEAGGRAASRSQGALYDGPNHHGRHEGVIC